MDLAGRSVQQVLLTPAHPFLVPSANLEAAVAAITPPTAQVAQVECPVLVLAAPRQRAATPLPQAQQAAPAKSLFVGKKG